jgi:hypothetical protein
MVRLALLDGAAGAEAAGQARAAGAVPWFFGPFSLTVAKSSNRIAALSLAVTIQPRARGSAHSSHMQVLGVEPTIDGCLIAIDEYTPGCTYLPRHAPGASLAL